MQAWVFKSWGMPRDRIRFEISRRPNNREADFFGDADGDHVSMNELAELDTCIVLDGDDVNRVIGRRYLQKDFRTGARKLSQFGQEHHLRRHPWNDESNPASRRLSMLSRFRYRSLDPL